MIAILNIGPQETIVILVVGLLIFGRRLPEVGRSLGKSLMEFRKGIQGFKDEVTRSEDYTESRRALEDLNRDVQTASQTEHPDYSYPNEDLVAEHDLEARPDDDPDSGDFPDRAHDPGEPTESSDPDVRDDPGIGVDDAVAALSGEDADASTGDPGQLEAPRENEQEPENEPPEEATDQPSEPEENDQEQRTK